MDEQRAGSLNKGDYDVEEVDAGEYSFQEGSASGIEFAGDVWFT